MNALHLLTECFDSSLLPVEGHNSIYWEAAGNPDGLPVLILHGGPGSGLSAGTRRFFDPERFRIIAFDQRGCGLSRPHAAEEEVDFSVNTTPHLIGDIEALRQHLGVERWLVFGASWGTTLALAYAEAHPKQVSALLLAGVTTTRRSEIDWLYRGVAPLFPVEWERFRRGVPRDTMDHELVSAYGKLLFDPSPAVRAKAARGWHDWEAGTISADPGAKPPERWAEPSYILARARIITHYFSHGAWLEEGALLSGASALVGISCIMVQGRLDLQAPLTTAWELAKIYRGSELVVISEAGHAVSDYGMGGALVDAANRLAAML